MGINVVGLRQSVVPNQLLGRVSSSFAVLVGMAMPLGALIVATKLVAEQPVSRLMTSIEYVSC